MTTFGQRAKMYRRWWVEKRAKYGPIWVASAPTPEGATPLFSVPRADKVDHSFSAVFERGTRHYAFTSEEARDDFVRVWPEAQKCEDPLP